MRSSWLILAIFGILYSIIYFSGINFDDITGLAAKDETVKEKMLEQNFGKINVYFCPKDDCEAALVKEIMKSNKVDCAFYDLNLENITKIISEKNYRLIIDDKNIKKINLTNVKSDKRNGLMHNKFCVLDNSRISTGSFNPTKNDAFRNNNNLVIIDSLTLAKNYGDEFNEMWNGEFGNGSNVKNPKLLFNGFLVENYFCPEDECEEQTLKLLRSAKERIYFMTFSFTSDNVGEEIIKNFHYGIDIKGVFEKFQSGSEYSEFGKMEELGIDVKLDNNPKNMHHKVFIVDNSVLLGSYNPTSSGNNGNDENILIIHDPRVAKEFVEEFDRIWS